ncbi:uncharacterized protein LOC117639655 [Thrips palmi]|uniref:Uncharacterized protein LOC117639655 n=1 Tax=Thrips palmi TaxID=161013 RepID=A0A6P8Y4Q0_THRPL|nr:uncharacterized protein LOC117639655 [Thrips palmi]
MDVDEGLVMAEAEDQDPDVSAPLQAQAAASSSPSRDRIRLVPAPRKRGLWKRKQDSSMKPNVVVDEMFPEGAGPYMDIDEPGGSSGLLMDLAANEKSVHTDFFNQFDDLYDDEDLS